MIEAEVYAWTGEVRAKLVAHWLRARGFTTRHCGSLVWIGGTPIPYELQGDVWKGVDASVANVGRSIVVDMVASLRSREREGRVKL